jgi:ribonucleoside-diphosphate reductase alpha chain
MKAKGEGMSILTDFGVKISDNAMEVLKKRYLKKDEDGNPVESPDEMIWRVSENIAQADGLYGKENEVYRTTERFYEMIRKFEFLPNSPTLMNAGRDLQQLSACFVIPVEDSMDSIFETLKHAALIHKSGGGTGFSFSRLRPRNDRVRSTHGVSSGPVSFMAVFDQATEHIKQGGARRGANMGNLRVDHPDILDFITCKSSGDKITNFNISVTVTDKFMEAVEKGEEYDLINPRTGKIAHQLDARDVWNLIAENAWSNGDPGVIFIDRVNQLHPANNVGEIEATNPCGEQPLLPYESCNLGSVNLNRFFKDGRIDFDHLSETVELATHFLDNIIDMNRYPVPQIEAITKRNRKIGLGVMGFADLLSLLHIPYNSDRAVELGEEIMKFIWEGAVETSQKLAEERGSYPNFKGSKWEREGIKKMRNACVTTVAPTGTIAMIANNCSSGIEPYFALCYEKHVMEGSHLLYVNGIFEEETRKKGIYSEDLMQKIAQKGSIQEFDEIPKDVREVFVTAGDISLDWHVRMQAAFQKYTDSAVSKTINLPNSATVDDVKKAYRLAYDEGCKGITIYRDGSRQFQVLTKGGPKETEESSEFDDTDVSGESREGRKVPRTRPQFTHGYTEKIKTGEGTMYVTINEDERGLCEIFTTIGKAGGTAAAQTEAISRLVSLALRSGIDVRSVIKQLKGISGPNPIWDNGDLILSVPDAIAKALERYLDRRKEPDLFNETVLTEEGSTLNGDEAQRELMMQNRGNLCPDCGSIMIYQEDCLTCHHCGFSKCS